MPQEIIKVNTVSEVYTFCGLPAPKHPLVSVVWAKDFPEFEAHYGTKYSTNLFIISLKDGMEGSMGYGRNSYDFTNGTMIFTKPNQVLTIEEKKIEDDAQGWMLLFHPDLIRKSELGKTIHQYNFFNYEVHEALHLSEDEKATLTDLVRKIEQEYQQNIDRHSQKLIINNIELLLGYCTRYYDRQFYTRTNLNQDILSQFEQLLRNYYADGNQHKQGIPSVTYCGQALNMSPKYLSDLLKKETGQNAKHHIDDFLINRAKTELLSSNQSVSEVAYELGFDYSQHFSKIFKAKTGMSPSAYRNVN